MYKETYYVVGNPLESDEYFMDEVEYFSTIGQAKQAIKKYVKEYGCRYKDYEIAKVTMIIERGIERVVL